MGDKSQGQALLNLLLAEKPEGHQSPIDIEEQKETKVVHEKKIESDRDSDEQGHEDGQVLFVNSAGRQGTMGKQTAVQFVILEIVGDPKPEQKRKDRKPPDQLLVAKAKRADAVIQKDDKVDLSKNNHAQGKSWKNRVHFPKVDGQALVHGRGLLCCKRYCYYLTSIYSKMEEERDSIIRGFGVARTPAPGWVLTLPYKYIKMIECLYEKSRESIAIIEDMVYDSNIQ